MLIEPLIQQNPLFGSRAVILVHVCADTPVCMLQQIHGLVDAFESGMEIVRRTDEHHRARHVRPIGTRVDGSSVKINVLEVDADSTATNATRKIDMLETRAAHKGDDGLQSLIGCCQRSDHSSHGKAGESNFQGIDFRLFFQKCNCPSRRNSKQEPV